MELQVGVAKVGKYAAGESGDTVEVVERPRGGLSVLVVDGQGSGSGAKRLSHQLVTRAASLLGDGARDGAMVRAVHDTLLTTRAGKVSATLTLLSADLETGELIVSRNSNTPVIVCRGGAGAGAGAGKVLEAGVPPLGMYRMTKPLIEQLPLQAGLKSVALTDGLVHAGRRRPGGVPVEVEELVRLASEQPPEGAQRIADAILSKAIEADLGKPGDDMAVAVLTVMEGETAHGVRRLEVHYPYS